MPYTQVTHFSITHAPCTNSIFFFILYGFYVKSHKKYNSIPPHTKLNYANNHIGSNLWGEFYVIKIQSCCSTFAMLD